MTISSNTSPHLSGTFLSPEYLSEKYGITTPLFFRNISVAGLIEEAVRRNSTPSADGLRGEGPCLTSTGALVAYSGEKTGRSPKDKRIVRNAESEKDIWWGEVNIEIDAHTFSVNRERAIDYLNTLERIYIVDGFAGWDPANQIKVRVICTRPYHALFMHNMLIRPTTEELAKFGEPDFVIYNAGKFPANRLTSKMTSKTSVSLNFESKEFVILGTEYAGEMKKGVFTIMNYLMPKRGHLSMHCSANEGPQKDVSLFFGLSGTGKTTLSADPKRALIGDDEHVWSDTGVFNIEGGCYAKCAGLTAEKEPEIFSAIRYGALLENVVLDASTHQVDFNNTSITENTRCAYPIEFIPNAKIPCRTHHPKNIIFLTADAFGVMHPIAKLSPEQAMYHFISGYTAKVAGTEQGVKDPEATFSACFGAAFMVWHPSVYAQLLARKMKEQGCRAWLINTGWTGGPYGVGKRINLAYTRAMIDAIHSGALDKVDFTLDPTFGFQIPVSVPGVPSEVLLSRNTWKNPNDYDAQAKRLAERFQKNFLKYRDGSPAEILKAGPSL